MITAAPLVRRRAVSLIDALEWPLEVWDDAVICAAWKPPISDLRYREGRRWEQCHQPVILAGSALSLTVALLSHAQQAEHVWHPSFDRLPAGSDEEVLRDELWDELGVTSQVFQALGGRQQR